MKNNYSYNELYSLAQNEKDVSVREQCIKRITPKTHLNILVVNICDHCNLNCRGCDHFSPIADARFLDLENIKKDLVQMKKILGEDINIISVMGGEPLLHPDLIEILDAARSTFSLANIWLSTNGILLLNQTVEFWNCCKKNNIEICVTKYPIKFDYNKAELLAEEYGVKWFYYRGGETEKTMGHYPLDIEGKQNAADSFMHCFHANGDCNMLNDGRLYTCTVAPNIPIFSKKYNVDMLLTEDDGIDIYQITDKKMLFEYLSKPMPMCRYCNVRRRTFNHPWGQSKGDIKEWIL